MFNSAIEKAPCHSAGGFCIAGDIPVRESTLTSSVLYARMQSSERRRRVPRGGHSSLWELRGGAGKEALLGRSWSGKEVRKMQLFLNKKEALVLEQALHLVERMGTPDKALIAQTLLARIALCLEKQKR